MDMTNPQFIPLPEKTYTIIFFYILFIFTSSQSQFLLQQEVFGVTSHWILLALLALSIQESIVLTRDAKELVVAKRHKKWVYILIILNIS